MTAICGSDLHLVDGFVPFMKSGDVLGHEPMGIVEEVGPDVDKSKVKVGDRVVVPFPIGCGESSPSSSQTSTSPAALPRAAGTAGP